MSRKRKVEDTKIIREEIPDGCTPMDLEEMVDGEPVFTVSPDNVVDWTEEEKKVRFGFANPKYRISCPLGYCLLVSTESEIALEKGLYTKQTIMSADGSEEISVAFVEEWDEEAGKFVAEFPVRVQCIKLGIDVVRIDLTK
jgi:hypothetical protein